VSYAGCRGYLAGSPLPDGRVVAHHAEMTTPIAAVGGNSKKKELS
jgi:hypothetical protein